jgi:internalin A
MKVLIERIPEAEPSPQFSMEGQREPTEAEGEGLYFLRMLLVELDPSRVFGDLRRVLDAAGDYLWVCEDHYSEYDPGLPILPGVRP